MNLVESPKINNLHVYENQETVDYYSHLSGLQGCEKFLFSKYLRPGADVLDLGVGGGRTTPYLSSEGRRYVGVDYSNAMTDICRNKFPKLQFYTLDASDLSFFEENKFDAVVFSFNGIDYLYPDAQRVKCLQEVNRVMKEGGVFIFSVHNAKLIFRRPELSSVGVARKIWRLFRSIRNILLLVKQLRCKVFYDGVGYITDSVHGDLLTHTSVPRFVKDELVKADFRVVEVVSSDYPVNSGKYTSAWFYYVAQKL